MQKDIIAIILSIVLICLAFVAGFYLIWWLERKTIYNTFTAVLFPTVTVLFLWLMGAFVSTIWVFLLTFLLPFLLIAGVSGGILAHHKRKRQRLLN
ncbi:hypothetical protein D0C36_17085 [Mucilaginibacter conchicola]|uniref:Uncharacterized protein n=1 Tax=Mucilaginibacter conchicola TaxID=2303333 RepID=A0A372NP84_9SPHI|nr:hypothetical protein D0C36_17085 [Mucilaginibacter conchicola]